MAPRRRDILAAAGALGLTGLGTVWSGWPRSGRAAADRGKPCMDTQYDPTTTDTGDHGARLANSARARIGQTQHYDPSYRAISYPGGDAPNDRGVCTDVIVRAYRDAFGTDLQQRVHEDMSAGFLAYPAARIWGQTAPDPNIDHRRVPNLETFLLRQRAQLAFGSARKPLDTDGLRVRAGDVLTWRLDGQLPHIGIVGDTDAVSGRPMSVIHNIGSGTREDPMASLVRHPVTGHFRWWPVA